MKNTETEKQQREMWVGMGDKRDRITPDTEYIASKDGVIHEVWKTDNIHESPFSTIGVIRFVLDPEGNMLAKQWPLSGFDNGFCSHSVESLKREADRYADYQEFMELTK